MSRLSDYSLLSFDVYGTLIDWETGILTALEPLISTSSSNTTYTKEQLLNTFHKLEAAQQSKTPDMKYSTLLATVHPQLAQALNLPPPTPQASQTFGQSISKWPAFPDTLDALQRLSRHYKLAILSNVDHSSFSATQTNALNSIPFTLILTAQDIGSYKPSPRNFEYLLTQAKEKLDIDKHQILQTAQSQFHDHHPARKMGIKSVWIVRPGGVMGNRAEEIYDWKFNTLGDMADAVEREVQ